MSIYTDREKLEFVASALKIQNERVKLGQVFKQEAEMIVGLAKKVSALTITDLGCWTGLLASEIFALWPELKNYHAVDAVPMFIEFAKKQLEGKPVDFTGVTLVPRLANLPEVASIKVSPFDTLNTASIYTGRVPSKQVLIELPVFSNSYITPFVTDHREFFSDDSYVKIDLDGVDIAVVETILAQDLHPCVIQFEVWKMFYDKGLASLRPELEKYGYVWPDIDYTVYKHFSIALTRGSGWWFVGYTPNEFDPRAFVANYKSDF